ncbi:hypothetical protein GCM10007111_13770 [Virgibacillus kapii]|uniref:Uncharacterized protein n=1 Tax=Virgibacillus kapii TaxID=1638645 RepID=A0ABQ2DCK1_9BACI|nr:hypothetical protein GCM10007111_13770 [Virgibacillus kapii]
MTHYYSYLRYLPYKHSFNNKKYNCKTHFNKSPEIFYSFWKVYPCRNEEKVEARLEVSKIIMY